MDLINTAIATTFTCAVAALIVWLVGSIALRFIGWGWIVFGVAIAIEGATASTATAGSHLLALFNIGIGATFWLCGHGLYAARHRRWKSPAARWLAHGLAAPLRRLRSARQRQGERRDLSHGQVEISGDTPRRGVSLSGPVSLDGYMSQQRRTASMLLRLTPDDREEVKRRAEEAGMSMQEYATAKLLDRPNVRFRPGPQPGAARQQELPLTG